MARIEDTQWVRGMFGLSPFVRGTPMTGRYSTSADLKFADTTLGGNAALNSEYQFTRYADVPSAGLLATPMGDLGVNSILQNERNTGSTQMGRVYSEVFDDNQNLLYMRFGLPKYTGSVAFLANAYDVDAARLAKYGEYSLAFRAGQIGGLWAMFFVVPWQVLIPVMLGVKTLTYFMNTKPSKYYYLVPRQDLYLQAVQSMVDQQAFYTKLLPITEFGDRMEDVTEKTTGIAETMENISRGLPDIWKSNHKIDVFKLVTRYQTLANYQEQKIAKITQHAIENGQDSNKAIKDYLDKVKRERRLSEAPNVEQFKMNNLMNAYVNNKFYGAVNTKEENDKWEAEKKSAELEAAGIIAKASQSGDVNTEQFAVSGGSADMSQTQMGAGGTRANWDPVTGQPIETTLGTAEQTGSDFWSKGGDSIFGWSDIGEQMASEARDGAQWIVWKVDGKQSVSESFSSSTSTPEISSAINGMSASARTIDFNTSGGNTGIDLVDYAVKSVKDFATGAISSLQLTGLLAVAGGSIIDFPEKWDSSTANFQSQSYTIRLGGPYGNEFSLFQDISIPMMFFLAGVLPLSTGKQSYISPFLVEAYCPGRQLTRLGIIDSLTINRGVGNFGWKPGGVALAVEISFTIKDLSSIVHMPLIRKTGIFDENSKYSDYMALLGGASLQDLTYALNRATLNFNIWKQSWKSRFMSGRVANDVMNTAPFRVMTSLMNGRTIIGSPVRPT